MKVKLMKTDEVLIDVTCMGNCLEFCFITGGESYFLQAEFIKRDSGAHGFTYHMVNGGELFVPNSFHAGKYTGIKISRKWWESLIDHGFEEVS
jgi:hypothetical protein